MPSIQNVWNSADSQVWEKGLQDYWGLIKPSLRNLEREIQQLDRERVRTMNAEEWYGFLLNKYFRWKYTAPNRYASTTKSLKVYEPRLFWIFCSALSNNFFQRTKKTSKNAFSWRVA